MFRISGATGAALSAGLLLGLSPASSASAKTVTFESNFGALTHDIYYGTVTSGVDGNGADVTGQAVVADFLRFSGGLRTTVLLRYINGYDPAFEQIDEYSSYATLTIGSHREPGINFFPEGPVVYAISDSGPAIANFSNAAMRGEECQICSIRGASASTSRYNGPDIYHLYLTSLILAPVENASFPGNLTDYVDYSVQAGDAARGFYDVGVPSSSAQGAFAINRVVGGSAHYRLREYDDQSTSFDVVFDHQSAAPEPASWTLLIAGFGLAGAALRRRRTLHVEQSAT